jgi:hypothetical protein
MRVRKPPSVQTKTFLFRPGRALHGTFSIGLAIESLPGGAKAATYDWCGSKRQLTFGPTMSGFVTNLRLPQNLSEGDVYVLSVSAPAMLIISVSLNGDEEAVESVAIEELDDGPSTQTVCADPTSAGDRTFEDMLASGSLVNPALRAAPLGRIESLRPFPDGGVLILTFRRAPGSATASPFLIHASVGELRGLGFMAAGQLEVSVYFRLQPAAAGETWPLTLGSAHAFIWSGAVYRNFDTIFLPAFSLVV